jgi:cytochrome c oxidase cbb3-type subunit 4
MSAATVYHIVLTLVFFAAFIALVVWVFRPGRKAEFERHAELPFAEEPARKEKDRHE